MVSGLVADSAVTYMPVWKHRKEVQREIGDKITTKLRPDQLYRHKFSLLAKENAFFASFGRHLGRLSFNFRPYVGVIGG